MYGSNTRRRPPCEQLLCLLWVRWFAALHAGVSSLTTAPLSVLRPFQAVFCFSLAIFLCFLSPGGGCDAPLYLGFLPGAGVGVLDRIGGDSAQASVDRYIHT